MSDINKQKQEMHEEELKAPENQENNEGKQETTPEEKLKKLRKNY